LLMLALEQVDVFTLLLNTTTVVAQNSWTCLRMLLLCIYMLLTLIHYPAPVQFFWKRVFKHEHGMSTVPSKP
jgi:hypothetical protein